MSALIGSAVERWNRDFNARGKTLEQVLDQQAAEVHAVTAKAASNLGEERQPKTG